MNKIIFFISIQSLSLLAFADSLGNARFHNDPVLKYNITLQNLKILDNFNKHNVIADSCPYGRGKRNEEIDIPTEMSKLKYNNVQCSKVESTRVFYNGGEPYVCDLDVTILKYNYSQDYLNTLSKKDQEKLLSTYWNEQRIIARWNLAAQALIKCKIRVKNIRMISFENNGSEAGINEATIDYSTDEFNQLISNFAVIEESKESLSAKFMYLDNIIDGPKTKNMYYSAISLFDADPNPQSVATVVIKQQSLATPIFSTFCGYNALPYSDEIHELGHILPRKDGKSGHIDSIKYPNICNPMTTDYERGIGEFSEQQCQELRSAGFSPDPKKRLIQCYNKERTIKIK